MSYWRFGVWSEKLYISLILDCYYGEILSLTICDNMKKELCIDTFKSLIQRYYLEDCILHSNRGSQYTSKVFRTASIQAGVQQSLSGVDYCYDNSRMESVFATLKKEMLYQLPTYRMKRDTVKPLVFRYVFTCYNQKKVYTANPGGYPCSLGIW